MDVQVVAQSDTDMPSSTVLVLFAASFLVLLVLLVLSSVLAVSYTHLTLPTNREV